MISTRVPQATYVSEEENEENKIMHIYNILRPSVGADLSAFGGGYDVRINLLRHGSNELDSSSSTNRSSPVILSVSEESHALGNEILR